MGFALIHVKSETVIDTIVRGSTNTGSCCNFAA